MKKYFVILSVIMLFTSCDPPRGYHNGEWYAKNCTEQKLTISFPPDERYWVSRDIAPGDSVLILSHRFEYKGKIMPYFDRLPQIMVSYSGEDISLNVLSEQGELLKKWSYLDKDLSGKQFFKETLWRYYERPGGSFEAAITATWVFDIMPEDLIEKDD